MSRPQSLLCLLIVAPALFAAACSDETTSSPDAAVNTGTGDAGTGDGATASTAQGLVVVHSDYKATAVSLIDPASGAVLKDNCITSGSSSTVLAAALSGDVVVPTMPQPGNEVLLIDRQVAALTWLAPSTCQVARQLNVGEGNDVNPQDVIPVSAHKAYVTRYNKVAGDLLIIDPSTATITGHVDLKPSAPMHAPPVLPNPSRGLIAGGKVYVVLTAEAADFMSAAPGRVVVVDPNTDAVTGTIDLPFQDCSSIAAAASGLAVACGGVYGDPDQAKNSGVAWIDLTTTPPTVKSVAATALGHPLSPFDVASMSSWQAFVIVGGDDKGAPDQLWSVDFIGGTPRKIYDASAAYTLSGLVVDGARNKLFVADGDMAMPRLKVFDLANQGTPPQSVMGNAAGLPPRYVSWY